MRQTGEEIEGDVMEGLNKVLLLGNLGADPELKIFSGSCVLKLRLATTESYYDKNDARQERTEWHSVAVWGKRGEALSKFLKKGDRIFVEGSIRSSSYEKDGEKRYRTEINATNIILNGSSGGKRNHVTHGSAAGTDPSPAPSEDFGAFDSTSDDDVPF
jgi:single-strand DNA-binding protein